MKKGSPSTERNTPFQYWAFISYSSKDRAWAEWLHTALETYRLPVQLVHHITPVGEPAPKRFKPLFWDRAELQAHHDLGELIERSLRTSRYLIVICSPNAAQSPWVEKEIQTFQQIHGPERILAIIVAGEPGTKNESNCFPPTLRAREPKAPDARQQGDGKTNSKLMLLATMLGVGFDQLKQRHVRRQRVLVGQVAAALLTVSLCLLWWWQGEQQEKRGIIRQNLINQRVEAGRQELMAGEPTRALAWLRSAYQDEQQDVITRYLLAQTLAKFETPHYTIADKTDQFTGAVFMGSSDYLLTARAQSGNVTYAVENGKEAAKPRLKKTPAATIRRSRPQSRIGFSFEGNEARCVNLVSGETVSILKGHSAPVISAFASTSERLVVTGSADMTARIWRIETGELVAVTPVQKAVATCARFSPDDLRLAAGYADGSISILDAASGVISQQLENLDSGITNLVLSSDGRAMAAETNSGSVTAWGTEGWQILGKLVPYPERTQAVFFGHPDAPIAVVVADEKKHTLKIINLTDGRVVREFKGHSAPIGHVCVSDAGDVLASQAMDRTIRVWDTATARCTHVFEAAGSFSPFEALGQHMDLAPDGGRLARVDAKGELTVWQITHALALPGQANGNGAQHVTGEAGGKMLLGWSKNQAWLWAAEPNRLIHTWRSPDNSIMNARLNADGTKAVIELEDGSLRAWDVSLGTMGDPSPSVWGAEFIANEDLCVAGIADEIRVLDLAGWRESKRFPIPPCPDEHAVSGIAQRFLRISPDGLCLAVSIGGSCVNLFELPSGKLIFTFRTEAKYGVQKLQWDPSGTRLLVGTRNAAEIWSREGVHLFTGSEAHEFAMISAAFSPRGRWFGTCGGDGFVHIYNTSSGAVQASLKAGSTFVNELSFSQDEELVMTSSNEAGVVVWSIRTGQPLNTLPGVIGSFSPSGRHILISADSALIMPHRLEDRGVEQISQMSQGFSPWDVRDEKLVPAAFTSHHPEVETQPPRK